MTETDPLAVVAIGGNALEAGPSQSDRAAQWSAARISAGHLADLAATGMRLVVTHGNGPQVGDELRRAELAEPELPRLWMDAAVAHTQGGIGYMLAQAVSDALAARGVDRPVAAVVTRALIDPADPAFAEPTKPIGPYMAELRALRMARLHDWQVRQVSARGWRRVVASPRPLSVLELPCVRRLVDGDAIVIAGGGGGVPVARAAGQTRGVEAVIDKDLLSSLMARQLEATVLLIATDVERVALGFGSAQQAWLDRMTLAEARAHLAAGEFPPGSMGPKVVAAVEFVAETGGRAVITALDRIVEAWRGRAGTEVVPG